MHYATLNLPAAPIHSFEDAINALPLRAIAIHKNLEEARKHIQDRGLIYHVELEQTPGITHNPNADVDEVSLGMISAFKQIDLIQDQNQSFTPCEFSSLRWELIQTVNKIDVMMDRVQTQQEHDFTLVDYFDNLLTKLDKLSQADPKLTPKLHQSLEILETFLNTHLTYPDYLIAIKQLQIPSHYERILQTMAYAMLALSLLICPSLILFTQVLSTSLGLSVMALAGIASFGLFNQSYPKLEYEQALTHLCTSDATINRQLSTYFDCDLPKTRFWGPQLG